VKFKDPNIEAVSLYCPLMFSCGIGRFVGTITKLSGNLDLVLDVKKIL
jgi:hypothetical protein